MLQFKLEKTKAMIEEFKPSTRKRDGADEPITNLRISTSLDADTLAFFEARLPDHYFDASAPRDLAQGLRLRDQNEVFPHKRLEAMSGAVVKIGYGIGNPMEFPDATADGFQITPVDGGSVTYYFWLQITPDEKQAGRLYMLQKQEVEITIEPAQETNGRIAA